MAASERRRPASAPTLPTRRPYRHCVGLRVCRQAVRRSCSSHSTLCGSSA